MISPLKMHHFLVPPCLLFFWQNSCSWWTQPFVPSAPALIWLNFAGKNPGQIDDSIKWKWSTSWIFSQHGPEILWFGFFGKLTSSNDSSQTLYILSSSLSHFQWVTLQVRSILHLMSLLFPSFNYQAFVQIIHISHLNRCYIFWPRNTVFYLVPLQSLFHSAKSDTPLLKILQWIPLHLE